MAGPTVSVGLCSSYKRRPYAAFRHFYTGVKSVTLGNYPLLLTGIKQETQADGVYVGNIFSSNPVMYLHILVLAIEANA